MKSTEKKNIRIDEEIFAQGKLWNKKSYARYRQYQNKFIHDTYRQFTMRINKAKEADIIEKLNEQENGSEYIKKLIRADIANGQNAQESAIVND